MSFLVTLALRYWWVLGIVAVVGALWWTASAALDRAYERGRVVAQAECREQFAAADRESQRLIAEARETGRLAGRAEGERLRAADETVRVETRTVIRRIEGPTLTVEACPLDAAALGEINAAINERREAFNRRPQ